MPTTPTAFAQATKFVTDKPELRARVLALYRNFMRNASNISSTYELAYPAAKIRTKIRQEFERHRFVQDVGVINHLASKGHMEFQETINFWKQQSHVYKFFLAEEATHEKQKPDDFLDKFIKGTA
ncbi:hypothetical protein TRVA0_041S00430 [Trichomonascus vanleenenianus]|uniref:NADH dehydrogenase [ubiquinone] 1 alpha subcomplex subunit 6 n=1 Tax=Trichomonascus vanleenenianus TaxID=2268995 RepID=UPI003EC97D07